jgi:hypothetical protein
MNKKFPELNETDAGYIKGLLAKGDDLKTIAPLFKMPYDSFKYAVLKLRKQGLLPSGKEKKQVISYKKIEVKKGKMYKEILRDSAHPVNLANYKKIQEWGGGIKKYKKKAPKISELSALETQG